ncbi:cellulose binding domain-containing protein [Streptomyces collinus]|uniref:cellulose binding domain-containing protein n=1 Tax=Streptomyces collinus TaxID=42684 RepID=UPI00339DF314
MISTLIALIVVAAGGTGLYHVWRAAQPPQLTIRYKAGTPATADATQPWFEVVNTSKKEVSLSDVTLRYYFTQDGAPEFAYNCLQAPMGCSGISGTVVAMDEPTSGADHYLEVSFTKGAGSLAAGEKGGAIGLQLYRPDGQKADQRNDRSYDAANTTFQPSKLVTAYLGGKHVWGDEPGGAETAQGTPATARPAPPAGVVFDNFHYSGPDDPALHAHGWIVRTSEGGPGIHGTWSASGVDFPYEKTAEGGQVLRLRARTDGTRAGTRQAEVMTSGVTFLTGTYAARVHFTDRPTSGTNGDHVTEAFYAISPDRARYSELDAEYQPNGGWGAPGPRLDLVTWHSKAHGDRVVRESVRSLQGWHTVMITAAHGKVTYSVDGRKLFTSGGRYYPSVNMSVNFNTWFVDLPFLGPRTWDMKVNWFYYRAHTAQTLPEVEKAVDDLSHTGTNYVNTVRK